MNMSACVTNDVPYMDTSLKSKVALWNKVADKHVKNQEVNPFSNGKSVDQLNRPKISREDYGRPPKGSLSELRAVKASIHVNREILQLCEVIDQSGERLFPESERPDDPRIVISFGELFTIYTAISDKVVGVLLRARKHKLVDFEGETLFQRQDDHVPIILLHPINKVREILNQKIQEAMKTLQENNEEPLFL